MTKIVSKGDPKSEPKSPKFDPKAIPKWGSKKTSNNNDFQHAGTMLYHRQSDENQWIFIIFRPPLEPGQMSSVETGQMSAAETGQMSAAEKRQMPTIATGRCPVSNYTSVLSQLVLARTGKLINVC